MKIRPTITTVFSLQYYVIYVELPNIVRVIATFTALMDGSNGVLGIGTLGGISHGCTVPFPFLLAGGALASL